MVSSRNSRQRSSTKRYSEKFRKKSQENTWHGIISLETLTVWTCKFNKNKTPLQVFSHELHKTFQDSFSV